MFVAVHAGNGSRVTSIAARWNNDVDSLRELAASGRLVCPGCRQTLWLRVGRRRRRHFVHRNLADCPLAHQSAEVLDAKAQLFEWLETKYPERVQLDAVVESSPSDHPFDVLVTPDKGQQFGYWIFDRQQRIRDAFLAWRRQRGTYVHFLHAASTLKLEKAHAIALTASQRDFITRSDFDQAVARHGGGHLHFILSETNEIRVFRGLHCVHEPNLYHWTNQRQKPLSEALISPRTGEIVFAEDAAAREAHRKEVARARWEKRQSRREKRTAVASPAKPKITIEEPTSDRNLSFPAPVLNPPTPGPPAASPEPSDAGPNINGPFRCEDCGTMTIEWSQAKPAEGTCVCRDCVNERARKRQK